MDPGSSNNLPLSRKLKDSCDLCSASKVRCERGKPACSRCTSLNEPCFYSPARRAGRPRRPRRENHSEQAQSRQQPQDLECLVASIGHGNQESDILAEFDWGSDISFDDTISPGAQVRIPPYAYACDQPERDSSTPLVSEKDAIIRMDCARTAALILERLDPAHTALTGSHLPKPGCKITEACQQLLTILVCPCSEQPAVALLVSSGCISLMDTALRLACGHEAMSPPVTNITADSPESWWTGAMNDGDNLQHQHRPYLNKDSFQRLNLPSPPQPLASMRGLVNSEEVGVESLAKIAKVVLRFAERYAVESHNVEQKGGSWAHTIRLVEPIIALLRSKLQSVTQEVTMRLVL